MDSKPMNALARAVAAAGLRVARFEFNYMAARRDGEGRKPPPKAERLLPEYLSAVGELGSKDGRVIIGGKSMGGRVASMVADQLFEAGSIMGLLCFGYPFHPPARPDRPRIAHLAQLRCPTLICQGTRDQFGTRAEVAKYALSPVIKLLWLEDGDHDLRPRKSVTGLAAEDHLRTITEEITGWPGQIQD